MVLKSVFQVLFRIISITIFVEMVNLLIEETSSSPLNLFAEIVLDITLLVLVGAPLLYLLVVKPFVKERDEAIELIRKLAHTDPLTNLPNRLMLDTFLEKSLATHTRRKQYGALLMLDLDGFKFINDEHGHEAGDAMLVEIAKRLHTFHRVEDIIARIGGDEFVLLFNQLGHDPLIAQECAYLIANRVVNVGKQPVDFKGKSLEVGVSIGIRLVEPEDKNPDILLKEADTAMYDAKATGKGQSVFFKKAT